MARKGYSFLKGALLLTAAGLVSRIIGSAARIILPRVIGPEAVGLLQMVYPIYIIFLVISISGIPVAISKLVSQEVALGRPYDAKRIFSLASRILLAAGILLSAALYWAAPMIANRIIGDPGALLPLRALSPAILLLSLSAAFRGLFQGLQEMKPSAVAQIVEQGTRVAVMIFLATLLMKRGVEWAATGAALGTVAGGSVGLAVLLLAYLWKGRRELTGKRTTHWKRRISTRQLVIRIYQLALPIVFGTLIFPISQSLDAAIVPRQLQNIGYSVEMARSLYGQLTGMALALVHFPCVLTIGLAMALVPAVSESLARKEYAVMQDRIANSLWLSVAIGLPASVGLFLLAEPLSTLLFKIPEVAIPLRIAAISTVFIAIAETSVGILQGLGQVVAPVRYLFFGAVVKIALTYLLTGIPEFGIRGAAAASVIGFSIPALFNFRALYRYAGYLPNLVQLVLKPLGAASVMGVVIMRLYPLLEVSSLYFFSQVNLVYTTLISVLSAVLVYLLTLLVLGGIPPRIYHLLRSSRGRILPG